MDRNDFMPLVASASTGLGEYDGLFEPVASDWDDAIGPGRDPIYQ